jgi:hypothetical protein
MPLFTQVRGREILRSPFAGSCIEFASTGPRIAPEANSRGVSEIYMWWCRMDMQSNEPFGTVQGPGEAKDQGPVIGPRPRWCEMRADMEDGEDRCRPAVAVHTDLNNHANECC